ncbi:hypothetical protein PLESTB_000310800 [Pleodorina starrii]|uniref:Major facilitator superfamily (MFS) profile domain-containing protein n=1 Tax=Pleodorina starrii TaxID=330485 RepID=A0A9W6BDX0_9CHLO|nr:hypothetical protein PLESTM_001721200 [Pleodorina starrii]GLC49807.1 hypothetical protein PLESTB_000310800 [Pleodorina starrii]GLC76234.1 hypothetical protein PLESTF_001753700 [Pleodorina starrii]
MLGSQAPRGALPRPCQLAQQPGSVHLTCVRRTVVRGLHTLLPTAQRPALSGCASSFGKGFGSQAQRLVIACGQQQPSDVRTNGGDASKSEPSSNGTGPTADGAAYHLNGGAAALSLPSTSGDVAPAPAVAAVVQQPHRWKVVYMMAVAFVLCNMDKVNMSVAVIPMASELGWSATERGLVSSSFFWGYSLTQLPAGYISTQIGGAKVLAAGVALWSFGTLVAPPAAQVSLLALCATRVLVGLGEGFAPSAATAVLAKLVPSTERSRAVSTVWGGLDVGSAVGLLLCGPLIRMFGWPSVFYLFAVLGLVWAALWPLVQPDKMDEDMIAEKKKKDQERAVRQALAAAQAAGGSGKPGVTLESVDEVPLSATYTKLEKGLPADSKVPWGEFFRSPPVWAVTVAHFCFNWGYYTLLAWLPSYFELALGLNVERSSFLTLIPYIAMTAMMPLVGPIADGWVRSGMPLTRVRKICQGIAFVGPAACMIACAILTPAAAVTAKAAATGGPVAGPVLTAVLVGLMSVAFALGAWSRAGLYCNHQDLSPKYASALLGITNTAGAVPGVLGVSAAGYLLDTTASWALALFIPTAICQLFGAVVYSILASSERQSWS